MVNILFRLPHDPQLTAETTAKLSPTAGRSPVKTRDSHPLSPLTESEPFFGFFDRYRTWNSNEERQPSLSSPRSSGSNSLELICDYDRAVTKLYEMLETSQWESAQIRCNTHPEEVHTWVVRRDVNGITRWKLLPLHAAIIFQAPISLIDNLLMQNPIAAAKRDDQGIIPLHLAFRHKSDETVIQKLLLQYPSGVMIKDKRKRLPLDHGKDMRFSPKLMALYAETFNKVKHAGASVVNKDTATELIAEYETRMDALKQAYEARIEAMEKNHEKIVAATKAKVEDDAGKQREIQNLEIDKLERMLAKEMLAERKTPEMDAELQDLRSSLAEATGEIIELRKVVEEQKEEKKMLLDELGQMLIDQTALHERCNKQQEHIDQAQKLREQLLRTLVQKENGTIFQESSEICQLSHINLSRTKRLLNNLSTVVPAKYPTEESSPRLPSNLPGNLPGDLPGDVTSDVTSDDEIRITNGRSSEPVDLTTTEAFDPNSDHGDDISAITDSSYLQPFGDR
mmetsp:Transcript_21092/g.58658  ORF Transcript_21092/g.58658 Transcript_21092/m.58658 type:complete len:511 (+) Transcript_21092:2031-3563(+)